MKRFVIASKAKQSRASGPDWICFVATFLAMTYFGGGSHYSETGRSEISQSLPLNCEMNSVFIGV
jgi:hypothetical protein